MFKDMFEGWYRPFMKPFAEKGTMVWYREFCQSVPQEVEYVQPELGGRSKILFPRSGRYAIVPTSDLSRHI